MSKITQLPPGRLNHLSYPEIKEFIKRYLAIVYCESNEELDHIGEELAEEIIDKHPGHPDIPYLLEAGARKRAELNEGYKGFMFEMYADLATVPVAIAPRTTKQLTNIDWQR